MDILHLRPTKSSKTNGVQNRTENAGIPQDQFPKQDLQPPPKRKPGPLHWARPASPSLVGSGPSRSVPPTLAPPPVPSRGIHSIRFPIDSLDQLPCPSSDPCSSLNGRSLAPHPAPCTLPVTLPRSFPLGLGAPLSRGHSPFPQAPLPDLQH